MDYFTLIAGLFIIAYGLGVIGWPYDVTRGIRPLERMPRVLRAIIGVMIMIAGTFLTFVSLL